MKYNFAAFILTHGRPKNVVTYSFLRKHGYTGPIVIFIDNKDKKSNKYIEEYGDEVYIFDKDKAKRDSEVGNNFNDLRSTTYPRNAMNEAAIKLGYDYYIQLDDDYNDFRYKFDDNLKYVHRKGINNLDKIFDILVSYVDKSPIKTICLAQGGDFFGGEESSLADTIKAKRKAMNSFVCSVKKPIKFIGQMNEDVNTYIVGGSRGEIYLTTNQVALQQAPTQATSGGMTDIYLDSGTYVKSFYSVMYQPSSVKVSKMSGRLHHSIDWKRTVPKILRESLKK